MILKNFFSSRRHDASVRRTYEAIVAQARQRRFYAELGVPDTVTGRYDMIVLHTVLVLHRLSGHEADAGDFSQELFDELFRDMDRSLREMGVGDLSVGKKVRKMVEVFYGRSDAYRAAIGRADGDGDGDDGEALKSVLQRNIYAGIMDAPGLEVLTSYVLAAHCDLAQQSLDSIIAGNIAFPGREHR